MRSNIFVEAVSTLVSLVSTDKVVQLLVFIIISLFSYYIYLKLKKRDVLDSVTLFALVGSTVILFGYLLNQGLPEDFNDEKLEILVFETGESYYTSTDEVIFHIKTNKQAFVYIYSYEKDKKMILSFPRNSKNSNLIPANKIKGININFSQDNSDFTHDQKVILVASTRSMPQAKKVMTQKSFSKMLEDNEDTKLYDIAEKQERSTRTLMIPINNNQVKIKIILDNNISKLEEEFYIDTIASSNGYITLFEGVPNSLDRVEGGNVKSDEKFKSQVDSVVQPLGEHIVVSIYTPQKEQITTNDFKVKAQEYKGGIEYSLKFKDKSYPYAIRTYKVID